MKTPRQLILERHQPHEPELDALSEVVAARATPRTSRESGWRHAPVSWRKRLEHALGLASHPLWKWYWRGIAGAWAIIFALHLISFGLADPNEKEKPPLRNAQLTNEEQELLRQQWAWRAELIKPFAASDHAASDPAPGPQSAIPHRRKVLLDYA